MLSETARKIIIKKEGLSISSHARKRLKERFNIEEYKQVSLAADAFINGINKPYRDLSKSRYVYRGMHFIFIWNHLITVFERENKNGIKN
jgi:hypothetical protein